jgi:hypothetical protein
MAHVRCPRCRRRAPDRHAVECSACGAALVGPRDVADRFERVAAFLVAQTVLDARDGTRSRFAASRYR